MKRKIFQKTALLLSVVLIVCSLSFVLTSCALTSSYQPAGTSESADIREDGNYSTKEEVAGYIHKYGKLPDNFITKSEAKSLGWDSKKGNLWDVAPGKSIGGDRYSNYEETLPVKNGIKYFECDINYSGGHRGAERIVYSSDGHVYYTNDHYETFSEV